MAREQSLRVVYSGFFFSFEILMLNTLLFLLFFHNFFERIIHHYYRSEYKLLSPVLKHSFLYSVLLIFPSFFIFNNPEVVWYFILTIFILHYSTDFIFFKINLFLQWNFSTLKDLHNYFHVVCLFYTYWCFNTT